MSKINRGIWCPRRAVGFVKEGQCSRRKGPGKGRSPAAARAPCWGPGTRGGGLSSGFVYLLAHGAQRGWSARHPGPTAVSRVWISSGQRVRQLWRRGLPLRSLPGPTRTPACMHGEETGPREERRARHITAAVMRLHSRQVCLITRRQTCLFQRPSSHTPTPVGSLVKGDVKGRGDDDDKGGRQQTRHNIYIYIYIRTSLKEQIHFYTILRLERIYCIKFK